MADSNAWVDWVTGMASAREVPPTLSAQSASRFVSVTFEGGRACFLDTAQPYTAAWTEVLTNFRESNLPVYIVTDPNSNVVTELRIPLMVKVGTLTPNAAGDAVEVELIISHARHFLRRSNPNYQALLDVLQTAQRQGATVLVTETDEHDIIDVRVSPKALAEAEVQAVPAKPAVAALAVSLQVAQQMFDLVSSQTCCPASASAPCIPFTYPDDGCWGRAHEMCRLMIAAGVQPDKVWIYGNLRAAAFNNPNCQVLWGWHVAPTLSVNSGGTVQTYVIDPSLFNSPVPQSTWGSVQGDPAALLQPSSAAVFYRTRNGAYVEYDATYAKTQQVLTTYRARLMVRATGPDGPPPYVQCLPRPPGVQWFGTVNGGATQRWFTWGWPANWHMAWTIMPLTACSGAPQLTWNVQVERANATQATYWIEVRNLTPNAVRFEGRYDILSR